VNGKGYKAITNQLNKLGYKTKKGNDFSVGSIREILTNPVYIGKVRYNVRQNWSEKRRRNINANPIITDGLHEPIIDESLWDKVQAIMESKKGKPSRIYDGEYPLTGILRCPKCGAGMVISRTTNKLADGTKKRIAYYCCGAWKNKGTSVCNSNTIRVDKANEYVFTKISELLSNEKMVKSIVNNINKERHNKIKPAKKELERIDKELEKIDRKKTKLFEAYEEELISKEEFKERKDELNKRAKSLQEEKEPFLVTLSDDVSEEIPYEFIKSILENFSKVVNFSTYMNNNFISVSTINKLFDNINLTNNIYHNKKNLDESQKNLENSSGFIKDLELDSNNSKETRSSNISRKENIRMEFEIFKTHPILGVGTGLSGMYKTDLVNPESMNNELERWTYMQKKVGIIKAIFPVASQYTTLLAEQGILGLLWFMVPELVCLFILVRKIYADSNLDMFSVAILISLLGFTLIGFTTSFYLTYMYWILLSFAGIAVFKTDN
ncbi:recombinase family protein, partial [Veillonella sp.]|uniref:recombinase family protein n=1 Tax=Veillonella sp. TaxID=1926307 RepID=UPI002579AFAC